jgi:hypothetical protein
MSSLRILRTVDPILHHNHMLISERVHLQLLQVTPLRCFLPFPLASCQPLLLKLSRVLEVVECQRRFPSKRYRQFQAVPDLDTHGWSVSWIGFLGVACLTCRPFHPLSAICLIWLLQSSSPCRCLARVFSHSSSRWVLHR